MSGEGVEWPAADPDGHNGGSTFPADDDGGDDEGGRKESPEPHHQLEGEEYSNGDDDGAAAAGRKNGHEESRSVKDNDDDDDDGRKRKRKPFVVSFENVTVHVPGGGWKCCTCIDSPLKTFGQEYMGMSVEERSSFYTLDRVSGYVRSGETCLVLGKSGSGKSTLLRALCGRLNETDELFGTVMLNGTPLGKNDQRWRRMSMYVSSSDADHSPVLTVSETFHFAAQCTSDGRGSREEIDSAVRSMEDALGLSHVGDTVVGDENLRGVSGGQKRRVTVGEMVMSEQSRFMCLDNITDGLASTDSLMLIDKISKFCKKEKVAAVIGLLQPSDEIIRLFDKLLVLSGSGETAYFGPVDRGTIRDVFLGPDADPSRDDAGALCDLILNQSTDVAHSLGETTREDEAAARFKDSPLHDDLVRDLGRIRAEAPPLREQEVHLGDFLPRERYSSPRWYQLRVIGSRRIKLIVRNSMTYSRVFIAILFGVIIGSLFSALQLDIIGALGRSGYLFLNSFLVLMLSAAVTIPEGFRQRATLFKHRSAAFYSGRVAYVAQVFLDIPLSLLEATLLASISYFWVNMNSAGADRFFYFLGTLIGLECVGQAFARLLCAIMRTQVSANTGSSLYILLCGAVSGFMPTYPQVTWVLRWLSWLTPVSYAFEGMMINEFDGRDMYGIVITDSNGVTNLGQVQGIDWLTTQGLPRVQWGTNNQIKLFDLGMLFVWAIVFDLVGMYFQEHTRSWFFNQIRRPQGKVHREDVHDEDDQPKLEFGTADSTSNEPESLSVRNLTYTVPLGNKKKWSIDALLGPCLTKCAGKNMHQEEVDKKELTLLNNVTARFRRGRMTALMGQSGAGKTTLLDVIAGYKTGGSISGDIMIDGRPKEDSIWKSINGYAEQSDILNPYLSVLETLEFTAACRLPKRIDKEAVIAYVVSLMGLEDYTSMVVGRESEGEGLPKHARKRLTIANQLVVLPKVLFLDEPTSGLGCNAAALVIGAVRRSTDALGLITLATIHQPSRTLFDTFDDLLLLAVGGRVAYMGPGSEQLMQHFSALSGTQPPSSCNPADYVLASVNKVGADSAVDAFKASSQCEVISSAIDVDIKEAHNPGSNTPDYTADQRHSFCAELWLLYRRHFICSWRNPSYSFMRMSVSFWASLFFGILFFDTKLNVQGAVFSIAAIFFLVFVLVIPMQAAVIPLIEDRAVLYREAVSGTYSRVSYGLGQLLADIPFHIFNTIIMFLCFYYMVGFRGGALYTGYFILMLFLANWVVMSMGQLYALVTPNEETANGLAGLSVILSVLLMGFLITVSAMPPGWVWAYWANLFHYILQGLVTNEVSGQTYHLDLGGLLSDSSATPSTNDAMGVLNTESAAPLSAITFGPGVIPSGTNNAAQASKLMSLVLEAGPGVNTLDSLDNLGDLVECMVEHECLVDPLYSNFISCNIFGIFNPPPCVDEYNAVVAGVNITKITECFLPASGTSDVATNPNNAAVGVPASFSTESFDGLFVWGQQSIVSCLVRTMMPAGEGVGVRSVGGILLNLYDITMIVLDILENGIGIDGNLILYYFGWATFENGELQANFKWHYCMTAVAVFLVAIELLKLYAVRFIVWTKR